MHSNIDIKEFRRRLSKNTLIGNPNINGTPFVVFSLLYQSHHKFFGRVNGNSFEITTHTTFKAIPYKIKGEISPTSNSKTNVTYQIVPIWFGYIWIKYVPLIILIPLLFAAFRIPSFWFPFLFFVVVFGLTYLINHSRIKRRLQRFEKDFKTLFEIE